MPYPLLSEIVDAVIYDREVRGLPSLQNALAARPYIIGILGDGPADEITRDDVIRFWRERKKTARVNTVVRDMGVLRRAFSLAIERGRLDVMPGFPPLGEDRKAIRTGFVTSDQVRAICQELDADTADLVAFLFASAWRKSEATSLLWQDVQPDAIRIHATKEGHSRILPVAGEIAPIIRRRAERTRPGVPFVFSRDGAQIGNFRKRWVSAVKRAGLLQHVYVHDLRRSALKRMVEAGVPAVQARQFSGHRTNATFERYAIQDISGLTAAAELVASAPQQGEDIFQANHQAFIKAGDRGRTGDLNLGKVALPNPETVEAQQSSKFRRVSRW